MPVWISFSRTRMFLASLFAFGLLLQTTAFCSCRVVDQGKSTPFDGTSLNGLLIEKKSLITLNKTYPALNVVEKVYKGELQTCSNCTEKYVTCTSDQISAFLPSMLKMRKSRDLALSEKARR